MVAYQNQFRRAEDQYIADRRQREAQRTRDFEISRQRQREQNFWAEHAAYVKRVTTPPKASKPEPPLLFPGHAATVFVPDESQQDASGKGIAELHRMERQQLVQAQERSRGSEIGVSQRAFERAADRKQQTLEQAHGLSRGPSR
jgi:hypothetical protein